LLTRIEYRILESKWRRTPSPSMTLKALTESELVTVEDLQLSSNRGCDSKASEVPELSNSWHFLPKKTCFTGLISKEAW
jgi:hypothetical protein